MAWDIKKVKQELRGPAGLAMTPFNEDLSLNAEALKGNLRYMIDAGVKTGSGFIICPSGSGDYLSLSAEEHLAMVKAALETADGGTPVVAGVAGVKLDDVIALAESARQAGARYTLIAPPFYYSIDQDGMYEWYRILSESLDMGIMIYDQSWRSDLGTTLVLPLIERLANLDNIVSLKYGNPNLMKEMVVALDRYHDRFAFIDNSLGFTAAVSHMHGATGFISGPSTWWPEFELEFFNLMEAGKYPEADKWHARLAPYLKWHHGEFSTAPRVFHDSAIIKAAQEYVGLYGGPLRPPFRAMTPQEKSELWATIEGMGLKLTARAVA